MVYLYDVVDELILNGCVIFNQEQVVYVYLMFGGIVMEFCVEVGDYVRKGDIFVILCSGEVVDYERQMKEVEQQVIIVCRNVNVIWDMFDFGLVFDKDVLQVCQELINVEVEENCIKEIFFINNFSGWLFYEVKFFVSGFIVEKSVSRNMQFCFDQGEEIFIVFGLEYVWVMVDVYESDISKVVEGVLVYIIMLVYLGKVFFGNIDKVYYMLNIESKIMNVWVKLCNEDYLLKLGMFIMVNVECKFFGKQMFWINVYVLIFEGGKNYVVIVIFDNCLKVKEVDVYKWQNQECYVCFGFFEGDRVLNQNVLLVYNSLNVD